MILFGNSNKIKLKYIIALQDILQDTHLIQMQGSLQLEIMDLRNI